MMKIFKTLGQHNLEQQIDNKRVQQTIHQHNITCSTNMILDRQINNLHATLIQLTTSRVHDQDYQTQ